MVRTNAQTVRGYLWSGKHAVYIFLLPSTTTRLSFFPKDGFPKLWSDFVEALMSIRKNRDGNVCKELLPDIVCPTLIIQGEKDVMVAPEHPHYLKDNIKNSKLELFPDGKHNLHLKYAKEFNEMVEEFLLTSK